MNSTIILYLNKICPFAQRAVITLEELGLSYQVKEVSLIKKEPWFTETYRKAFGHDPNSDGKVPILIDGDQTIVESDLISWYLIQKYGPATELIPSNPLKRLKMRFFTQAHGPLIGAFYGFKGFLTKKNEEKEEQVKNLEKLLEQLNSSLILPYSQGDQFTLADILLYPWFERWCAIESLVGVKIDKKYENIQKWIRNVSQRESLKKIRLPDQFFIEGYRPYYV